MHQNRSTDRPAAASSEIVQIDGRVYHLGLAPNELAHRVILVGDPARATLVANRFDRIDHEVRHREYVTYTGSYRGAEVSVIGTGIGADNVEIALVEAYVLHEFDLESCRRHTPRPSPMTWIRVGTSGGMRPDVAPGTMAIASYGLGLDNTGRFFDVPEADDAIAELERAAASAIAAATPEDRRFRRGFQPYASKATPEIVTELARQAADRSIPYEIGVTVTAPGFYGASGRFIEGLDNTVPEIKHRLGEITVGEHRVVNVEMESSLLFHLATAIGYRAGTLCPVISSPGEHAVVIDYQEAIDRAIEIGLEALVAIG